MATVLAVETSSSACSVALMKNGDIEEDFQVIPKSHTQCLLPMIDRLLAKHEVSLNAIDVIGLSTGPGSFTGLRIGLGVVQGLAFGAELPVVGVSSLRVMAASAFRLLTLNEGTICIPCFDARMQEVYWASYGAQNKLCVTDSVASPEAVVEYLQKSPLPAVGVGDGWNCIDLANSSAEILKIESEFYPHAYDVAVLAQGIFDRNEAQSVFDIEPVYVRNDVNWKKRQRIRLWSP